MVKMARVHQPLGLILGFCLTTAALAAPTAAKGPNLDSDARKLSYSVGISLGNRLRDDFTNLDMEALTAGLRHGLDGTKPALSEEEMQKIFADWSSKKTAADQQARCTPIYEELEGWSENTAGARSWAELPGAAIKYVRRIEELIQCPVALLSTSPERDDTILVRDPFMD